MISDNRSRSPFTRKASKFAPKSGQRAIRTPDLLEEDWRAEKPRSSTTIRPIRVLEIYRAPLDRSRNSFWLRPVLICVTIIMLSTLAWISAELSQQPFTVMQSLSFIGVYDIHQTAVLGSVSAWESSGPQAPPQAPPLIRGKGPYLVLGKPTLTSPFIDQVLTAYRSPAAGQGQVLYDIGVKYQIDPAVALAFFLQDSGLGTAGEARITHSLGNTGCVKVFPCLAGHPHYPSWAEGFEQWYQLIHNLYVAQMQRRTLETIIPKYSPLLDHKDEIAYINALKLSLDTWHSGRLIV